ncbi:MAG: response regulator [Caulobacterales bacterium]
MARTIDVSARFNLTQAVVLILDRSTHSADVIQQVLLGFGVSKFLRSTTAARAMELLRVNNVDLVIVDPELEDEDGFEFIRSLRRSRCDNRLVPVMLVSGHAKISSIKRARDTGANFFVAKPITPTVLIQRIFWIASDKRQFVDVNQGAYIGPDRRFKFEGPPMGAEDRREADIETGATSAESDLQPQKVSI